jgi:hypothetical protein
MTTPTRNTLLDVVNPIEPYNWTKHNLTVVGDGHLDDGTRVHLVSENLEQQPIKLNNAIVISAKE